MYCYQNKTRTGKLQNKEGIYPKTTKSPLKYLETNIQVFSRRDITYDASIFDSIQDHQTLIHLDDDIKYEEVRKILRNF